MPAVRGQRKTVCPKCGEPALLTDARRVGSRFIEEAGVELQTTERRIECSCAAAGRVHVVFRVELYRGESTVWSVRTPRASRAHHKI